MLKFLVFENGRPAKDLTIRNAYLLGADGNAIWGEIEFDRGMILCRKRETGVAALALQRRVGDCGELTVQTCILPEREEPYLLDMELARHRLMLLYNKLEDWGMFDLPDDHPVLQRFNVARKLFISALSCAAENPVEADRLGRDALVAAVDGSEELALAHAEALLNRRKATGSLPARTMGCGVDLNQTHERIRGGLGVNFDFLRLPIPWRALAPAEGDYRWALLDNWVEWARVNQLPIIAGPIVSFEPNALPDWIYIWEDEYEQIRDLLYEHIERVVTRYRNAISAWDVVAGLHVNNHLSFSFDQLLDLTRMATMLVKKTAPTSQVLVEIRQPFGEYYARNPRSIPPMMYVDLLIQGAVQVDGFVLKVLMGQPLNGQYVRDLMQISHLLDHFAGLEIPLHLVIGVPSYPVPETMMTDDEPDQPIDPNCGFWRRPWSLQVQSHWLEAMFQIGLSKPFVASVAWQDIIDHPQVDLPGVGLVTDELQPKAAFSRLIGFRRSLTAVPRTMAQEESTINIQPPAPPASADPG
ncbi:MAG: endo-1,4-beta-xylanase [Phycisphaeraceae bacterium]|nr:endo-1,4-beta-xylanase [Phycisphaeraceae bacterium]